MDNINIPAFYLVILLISVFAFFGWSLNIISNQQNALAKQPSSQGQIITTNPPPPSPPQLDPDTIDDLALGEVPPARRDYRKIYDPLKEPSRRYVNYPTLNSPPAYPGAVNIPTQGYLPAYQMMGFLVNKNDPDQTLKLFGRRTDRERYEYYATHHKDRTLKLPLDTKGERELMGGEQVKVPGYEGQDFNVNVYELEGPKYIPYV